jgi:hypothetical protein
MTNKMNRDRRVSVRSVRLDPPDLRRLSRALIALAVAQAEAEAEAEHHNRQDSEPQGSRKRRGP